QPGGDQGFRWQHAGVSGFRRQLPRAQHAHRHLRQARVRPRPRHGRDPDGWQPLLPRGRRCFRSLPCGQRLSRAAGQNARHGSADARWRRGLVRAAEIRAQPAHGRAPDLPASALSRRHRGAEGRDAGRPGEDQGGRGMTPVSVLAATLLLGLASVPQANGPRNVNWTQYFADTSGSRFAPLDQINATNFSNLEVAWRFKTDNLGNHPEYKLEGTPLEVDGVVYATAGNRRGVVALDATTGELLWVHGEREGKRGAAAPRQLSGRGLSYWAGSNGQGARILYVTPGYFLIALDAKTGQPVPSFGIAGKVDLKATDDQKIMPDLTTGEIGWQSAPTVVGDEVLVGSAFKEGFTPSSFRNNRGSARAYDVRSGKKLWQWNTIPVKGAKGYDTWLGGS